ncbi:MAG: glycosyltransferase family 4 protein [Bacteroidota bacterium]|nr:glycosyltransferase family 4 protein [Bacteroidota bacterium]
MRIALITDGIWPYVLGGMQKHSYYLCKYLAQNKVQVDLVHYNASNYDIAKLEFFTNEEKKYITPIIINFPKGLPFPGHYIYKSYKHSKLIFQAIKDNLQAYDFVYTKGFTGWYLINQKKSGRINCNKIGVKFHGYEMFQKPPDFKIKLQHIFLLRRPVKKISRNADIVFSYGGKITDIIKSIGVDVSKIIELPSGVESSILAGKIAPTSEKIKFLFLGRYERRKGVEELSRAITNLKGQNFEFHFIGPIPEEKKLQNKNVTYHNEIRDKQILNALIKKCDVLVCSSWSEGMPNVILEGMANGLAILATDVGATNVLVNTETGWLLKNCNVTKIEENLIKIINTSPQEVDSKKQTALKTITENFVWEKLIINLINKLKR